MKGILIMQLINYYILLHLQPPKRSFNKSFDQKKQIS